MRAYELLEDTSSIHDILLKLRKGMAASLNASKLAEIFTVLQGWKIEKSKSYRLSEGGWVISEILNGAVKKFHISWNRSGDGRIHCEATIPRDASLYGDALGAKWQQDRAAEDQSKFDQLSAIAEQLRKLSTAPEKGKWFVRDVKAVQQPNRHGHAGYDVLDVSFNLFVQTSGFTITSPDGQTYDIFGDHKNGAIGAQTFPQWFSWAVEHTEIMDQILGVLGMEPHEKKHDPKDRYTPPLGAPAEVTRIFELLKTITNDVRDEQKAGMVEMATKAVLNFAEAVAADDKKKMRQMIESQNGFIISRCYDIRKKELDKDWEATIEKYSENQVEEMQNQFVYKNTRKLASIASAKGGMREQKVLSVTAHQGVIEAALLFTFDDGSSFRVDQSIVFSRSVHNTPFVRFPTTFHDVIMPDGSKMGYPSEERMNEIFAKA